MATKKMQPEAIERKDLRAPVGTPGTVQEEWDPLRPRTTQTEIQRLTRQPQWSQTRIVVSIILFLVIAGGLALYVAYVFLWKPTLPRRYHCEKRTGLCIEYGDAESDNPGEYETLEKCQEAACTKEEATTTS